MPVEVTQMGIAMLRDIGDRSPCLGLFSPDRGPGARPFVSNETTYAGIQFFLVRFSFAVQFAFCCETEGELSEARNGRLPDAPAWSLEYLSLPLLRCIIELDV
jgi:hypothetical protein